MHFLYFQMIETLFEIIFAIFKYGHKNIWFNLTNSNWKKNYNEIKDLNESSDLFTRKITVSSGENKQDLLLIKWIFYFVYSPNKTDLEWESNFNKIKEFLLIFASDFSDRDEYNAFKHAMRFYNSSFSAYFGFQGMKDMQMICKSNDSITYLEEKMIEEIKTKNKPVYRIYITTKPFYFDIDFNCCKIIYSMIKNIIDSRKHYLLPNSYKEKLNLIIYNNFDIDKDYLPESSLTKQSFPV